MRRVNQDVWVFNPGEQDVVLAADAEERALIAVGAHTRRCCLSGHRCKRGEKCRARCLDCHRDAMEVWAGKRWRLDKVADVLMATGLSLSELRVIAVLMELI